MHIILQTVFRFSESREFNLFNLHFLLYYKLDLQFNQNPYRAPSHPRISWARPSQHL
jgi:hypothetical protein